jgi:AGZA family xanthine/uracil permease-like MFS transporter
LAIAPRTIEPPTFLERTFHLTQNKTTVRTEVMAGVTTFMTMAYIIFVNPSILSAAGMPFGSVMVATILAAAFATVVMALAANYPFALAPGMGMNAFFTYTVVLGLGHSWQTALGAVFLSSIICLAVTLSGARERIINDVPMSLKMALGVGIGLFIAFIGFKNAGVIVANPGTTVGLINPHYFQDPALSALLPYGCTPASVILFLIGLAVTGWLVVKNVKGALLWGILATTVIGIPMGVTQIPAGFVPFSAPPSLATTFLALDLKSVLTVAMIPIIFTMAFTDLFDTVGTFVGVSSKAGMLDENGRLPRGGRALVADSVGSFIGSLLGTSNTTTYVESASGVAEGGRTGLTGIVVALLFLLSLFLAPLVGIIPVAATAPVLVIVGIFMMEPVMKIDFSKYLIAIPAFLTIVMMPFAFSIAEGIVAGVVSFVLLHLLTGKAEEIRPTMWVLGGLFVLRYIFLV